MNYSDTQALADQFQAAGFTVLGLEGEPGGDVYIINSCTVTAESDKKTRRVFARLKKDNPGALMVLTGCMVQASPEAATALGADIIIGNRDRAGLVEMVNRRLKGESPIIYVPAHERGEAFERLSAASYERTRAFFKIQDGCDRFCSYCIIPFARGPVRSMPLEEVEENVRSIVAAGHKEIVLSGINLASYGREWGMSVADAVEGAAKAGAERIRLGSVEPDLMTRPVLERLAKVPAFCPQFHLSLQSGSDSVLSRMKRRYDTALYATVKENIEELFQNPSLTTDIMVGFPGETEDEFRESMEYCKRRGFLRMHVFAYSPRKGTKAAEMPDQIPSGVKKERSAKMNYLAHQLALRFYEGQVGKTAAVLVETESKGFYEGYSENYTPVRLKTEGEDPRKRILSVRITGFDEKGCIGEPV